MTTKISEPIRREVEIEGQTYTIVLTTRGVRMTRKRFRNAKLVTWQQILELEESGREPANSD